MKAATYHRYGTPDVLDVADVATPEPGAHDVRIRIVATTVASEDATFRRGDPLIARTATGLLRPGKPILGTQFSGIVDAVGPDVTRFTPGDAVFGETGPGFGAHAEFVVVPENGALQPAPESVSLVDAAAVAGGELTALAFLRDEGALKEGDRVLVIGASGSVGSAAVQLARALGAHVTGVTSTSNVDLVRSLGADEVLDYTKTDFAGTGEHWDIVFDTVGASSYGHARRALTPEGRYLSTVLNARIVTDMLRTRGRRARIAFTGLRDASAKRNDLVTIRNLVDAGALRPVVDRTFDFHDVAEAHRYVETGRKRGNVILTMGDS